MFKFKYKKEKELELIRIGSRLIPGIQSPSHLTSVHRAACSRCCDSFSPPNAVRESQTNVNDVPVQQESPESHDIDSEQKTFIFCVQKLLSYANVTSLCQHSSVEHCF